MSEFVENSSIAAPVSQPLFLRRWFVVGGCFMGVLPGPALGLMSGHFA
jgi:hypothetical protein